MFRNDRTSWSGEDIKRLAELYFSQPKPPIEDMAFQLGRTPSAVFTELSRLGMAKPGVKLRSCMPCTRLFFSSWIGERICSYCKESEIMRCAS